MAHLTNDSLALEVRPHASEHGWTIYTVRYLFDGQSIINPALIRRSAEYRHIPPGFLMAEVHGCGRLLEVLDAALDGNDVVWSGDEPHFVLNIQHRTWEGADENSRVYVVEARADAYCLDGRDYFGSEALILRLALVRGDLERFRDELKVECEINTFHPAG